MKRKLHQRALSFVKIYHIFQLILFNFLLSIRLKELHDTLAQAKEEAIRKLREKLALKKKLDYINMFRIENAMFEHAAQITRAFVFSYFDMLQWLQPNGPTLVEQVPDNMAFPVEA